MHQLNENLRRCKTEDNVKYTIRKVLLLESKYIPKIKINDLFVLPNSTLCIVEYRPF